MRTRVERWKLPLCGALLQCLDSGCREIPGATASGFVRHEPDGYYLYTCWHVVSGFDPYCRQSPETPPPKRHFLRVTFQGVEPRDGGAISIGGSQTLDLPLYTEDEGRLRPSWLQDQDDTPNLEVNSVGLRVPFWHDAVKLRLPDSTRLSDLQVIAERAVFGLAGEFLTVGDKVYVVGYPHGFSTSGPSQPAAVVLTRFVAGTNVFGRHRQFLLESTGAAGMSGGPVFVDCAGYPLLIGVYTGLVFPDYLRANPERATALGTVADLSAHLLGQSPFSRPETPEHTQ